MLKIDAEGNITLTQGNSAEIAIVPYYNTEDEPIVPEEGDKVIFCVKCARKAIIKKELTAAVNYVFDPVTTGVGGYHFQAFNADGASTAHYVRPLILFG